MLIFITSRIATAEIMVAPTLEWLADHCAHSGVYRVTAIEKKAGVTESYVVTFERHKSLRGEPKAMTQESYFQFRLTSDRERPLVKVGDGFLVCFQHLSNGGKKAAQLINLSGPQTSGPAFIAVTSDLKILKTRNTIMDVFLKRLKQYPRGDPVEYGDYSKDHRVELEPGTEAFDAIYSGSSCFLKVPQDLLLE